METLEEVLADPGKRPRRRRWLVIGISAAVVVVAGAATVGSLLLSKPEAPTPGSSFAHIDSGDDTNISDRPLASVPSPTPAPLSDNKDIEVKRATASVDAVIAAQDEIAARADGSDVGLESIATGWVLGELQAHAREQHDLGYRQTGNGVVTSVTPVSVDFDADPPTIVIKVCVDVSGIDVVDTAGNSLKDSLYNPGHPVAHLYGAIFEDDIWKISTHEIPSTQDCAAG